MQTLKREKTAVVRAIGEEIGAAESVVNGGVLVCPSNNVVESGFFRVIGRYADHCAQSEGSCRSVLTDSQQTAVI